VVNVLFISDLIFTTYGPLLTEHSSAVSVFTQSCLQFSRHRH